MCTVNRTRLGAALCAAAWLMTGIASAASISLTPNPVGPIQLNDEFDVDIHLSDWNPADGMLDGITLAIGFDPMFSFVSGSADAGGFLAEGQQPSYAVTDNSGPSGSQFLLSFFDNSFNVDNVVGSVGGADHAGRLGQRRLRADALGTGNFTPGADGGDEDFVFFDQLLFNVPASGAITWTGASMTVIPEPGETGLLVLAAAGVAVVWFRRNRDRRDGRTPSP